MQFSLICLHSSTPVFCSVKQFVKFKLHEWQKKCHSCSLTEQKTGVEHFLQRFVFQYAPRYAHIVLMHVCTFFVASTFKYKFYAGMHFISHSIDCFFCKYFFMFEISGCFCCSWKSSLENCIECNYELHSQSMYVRLKKNFMQIISVMHKKRETFAINLRRPLALALPCCFFLMLNMTKIAIIITIFAWPNQTCRWHQQQKHVLSNSVVFMIAQWSYIRFPLGCVFFSNIFFPLKILFIFAYFCYNIRIFF